MKKLLRQSESNPKGNTSKNVFVYLLRFNTELDIDGINEDHIFPQVTSPAPEDTDGEREGNNRIL